MNDKLETTRKRVEHQLVSNSDSDLKQMLQEFLTALEELQVADEGLRNQNEELLAGRQALEDERQRYQDLFDATPDAYLLTDRLGVVEEANQVALMLLNIDQRFLIGKPLFSFVPEGNRREFRTALTHSKTMVDIEMTFKRRSGPDFEAAVRIAPVTNSSGVLTGFRWIIRDITEQKQMARQLRESQERLQSIFAHATTGIVLLNKDRKIADFNPAFRKLLQYPAEDLQGVDVARFIFTDDQPFFYGRLARLFDVPAENFKAEIRFQSRDERIFWGLVSVSAMHHHAGSGPYAILMVEDITANKQLAAERVEMHHRLIDGIEAERTHLARELHDNALQTLYAALYQLGAIDKQDIDRETQQKFESAYTVLSRVIDTIRVASSELRSPALNTFGLKQGIASYVDRFREIHPDIQINTDLEGDNVRLPERLTLAIYRILQECMSNVVRHSQATAVDITFRQQDNQVSLRVADNGVGFDLPQSLVGYMRTGHYGLAGIAERVEMIGGELNIESSPGNGTVITVVVEEKRDEDRF